MFLCKLFFLLSLDMLLVTSDRGPKNPGIYFQCFHPLDPLFVIYSQTGQNIMN